MTVNILIAYAIALIVSGGMLCLLAFWLIVADAERSMEPPPLPSYGEEHD
jgi:hypothetical protein